MQKTFSARPSHRRGDGGGKKPEAAKNPAESKKFGVVSISISVFPVVLGMRRPRKTQVGATYHVVARANRREHILRDDRAKHLFLETVQRAKEKYSFRILNICIMGNHFHLMIEPARNESLSKIMQWILSVFARQFNRAYSLEGHVWYDRFKSKIISSLRQFVATFSYISENPVRANLVTRSEDYAYGGPAFIRAGPGWIVERPSALVRLLFPGFGNQALPVQ
ncbi:MAG: transposase [Spirochaetia bacterium]